MERRKYSKGRRINRSDNREATEIMIREGLRDGNKDKIKEGRM